MSAGAAAAAPGAALLSSAAQRLAGAVVKILTSRTALEGERKPVTVLFANVKGSPVVSPVSLLCVFSL